MRWDIPIFIFFERRKILRNHNPEFLIHVMKSVQRIKCQAMLLFYRLQLADAVSEKATIEKEKRREADAEVREIHQR